MKLSGRRNKKEKNTAVDVRQNKVQQTKTIEEVKRDKKREKWGELWNIKKYSIGGTVLV